MARSKFRSVIPEEIEPADTKLVMQLNQEDV